MALNTVRLIAAECAKFYANDSLSQAVPVVCLIIDGQPQTFHFLGATSHGKIIMIPISGLEISSGMDPSALRALVRAAIVQNDDLECLQPVTD